MEKIYFICISLIFLISLAKYSEQKSPKDKNISDWMECLPSNKIVGGEPIDIKEAPFTLVLMQFYWFLYLHICTATILSEKIALTAAHCTANYNIEDLKLLSGTSTDDEGNSHYISKVVNHDLYVNNMAYFHDIALVFVKEPFSFSDTVQPIKLPTKEIATGTLIMVAGYGKTLEGPTQPKDTGVLKRAIIPIIDRKLCERVVIEKAKETPDKPLPPHPVTEMMICAGYPGGKVDTCQGDSGGPLYYEGTLYGVVNWGIGCALPCSPGVYASVYKYLGWINKTIAENSQ